MGRETEVNIICIYEQMQKTGFHKSQHFCMYDKVHKNEDFTKIDLKESNSLKEAYKTNFY